MKLFILSFLFFILVSSCTINDHPSENHKEYFSLEFGGDFSIMKKMEDNGGLYKIDGVVKEGFEIFKENGYSWARLRIFHTPSQKGPLCNNLLYTLEMAQKAKKFGLKVLLNFHYSDTWADPGHQTIPAAWKNLSLAEIEDSVYNYTKKVITVMNSEGVLPDMVQIGNEINNGILWPHGKLWLGQGVANWINLTNLLKSGINGVRDAKNGSDIPIMIHAATGGDVNSSFRFYTNIIKHGVEFDIIGLTYYPWWHGTFLELESNILYLSSQFEHDFSIVETAYYSNNWYPKPANWNLSTQPYPATEEGQYFFLLELAQIAKKNPRIKTIFYWKPDGLEIPKTKVNYLGRSLFDEDGNALKGISAWKEVR